MKDFYQGRYPLTRNDGRKTRRPMTVCIGAISNSGAIFLASDRMLTSGEDLEYEPAHPALPAFSKIQPITTSIVTMVAGDTAIHTEIINNHVHPGVSRLIKENPNRWIPVYEIVELYVQGYNSVRRKAAEREVLLPLGLNFETFTADQQKMSETMVLKIKSSLDNFHLENTSAIIAGTEPAENPELFYSRLYSIYRNSPYSCEMSGFAAIGLGSRHAESHFMLAGYNRSFPPAETLLLTYSAKKKAEKAPGVGAATDMHLIPGVGQSLRMLDSVIVKTDEIYKKMERRQRKAAEVANEEVTKFVNTLAGPASPDQKVENSGASEPKTSA